MPLVSFFHPSELASLTPSGRPGSARRGSVGTLDTAHLHFLGARLGRHVVVEGPCLGLLYVLIEDQPDDDALMAAEGPGDAKAIALADEAIGFGGLAADFDFAALAGAFGFRACLEETRDVEPDI